MSEDSERVENFALGISELLIEHYPENDQKEELLNIFLRNVAYCHGNIIGSIEKLEATLYEGIPMDPKRREQIEEDLGKEAIRKISKVIAAVRREEAELKRDREKHDE